MDVINRMLAKAPGINELRNLLSQILHERDAEGKIDIVYGNIHFVFVQCNDMNKDAVFPYIVFIIVFCYFICLFY